MDDQLFRFEDIHVKALLKILNFLSHEFVETKASTKPALPRGKGRPPSKATTKPVVPQMNIESIDLQNRQIIIDSILNCCLYFDQYFKYNYKFGKYWPLLTQILTLVLRRFSGHQDRQ